LPTIDILQVQHLVSYVIGLIGTLVDDIGIAFNDFGATTVSSAAADSNAMPMLTTGIFGTHSGLIYWLNNKLFYLIENFPWCDFGQALSVLLRGLLDASPCP